MNFQDRGISPNPFDGDFLPGQTIRLKRSDLLDSDAFSEIEGMPAELANALRGYAREKAIKGLVAIVEADHQIDLRIIQNHLPKGSVAAARISLHEMNLQLLGIGSTWVDMGGSSFEEIEADIKKEVSLNPKAVLAGIFRFTG